MTTDQLRDVGQRPSAAPGGAAEGAEVGLGAALAKAALVFLDRDVKLPLQMVFD